MWTLGRREISQKIQLKLGEKNATLLAHHNSFVSIINQVLPGDGQPKSHAPSGGLPSGAQDLTAGHGSVESAISAINAAMRF